MKKKLVSVILLVMLSGLSVLFAQGFKPPAPGKAVVYFVRVTSVGFAISFEYFHQDKYIGVFKGKNYMRFELDPGNQLLWASSENKEFITADLKEGGTYIVIVDVNMGVWKARVGFNTLTVDNKELFTRAKELINEKPPVVTSDEDIAKMNVKLKDFIAEKLKSYNDEWKNTKNFKHISADMAIPEEAMK